MGGLSWEKQKEKQPPVALVRNGDPEPHHKQRSQRDSQLFPKVETFLKKKKLTLSPLLAV